MCGITRRDVLRGSATLLGATALNRRVLGALSADTSDVGKVDRVAPEIYFHVGDISRGLSNNGWIIFEDCVLVIDANFPLGAQEILPKIRALTDKPIRFAFDTHHHGDHIYGNQIWVETGATPLAHTGVIEEMRRYETGFYDGKPGRWEETAKQRPDVKASHLKPPSLLFPNELFFDDGKHRVELYHLGIAHTHGDAVAWLPKERILFAGDVCVNGPYNYVSDGNVEKWITTLEAARKLGAQVICPGHGSRGANSLLADQQKFFQAICTQVGSLVRAGKSSQEVKDSVEKIRQEVLRQASISRFVGDGFSSQVEKVYTEMTGQGFPTAKETALAARRWHAHAHGLQLVA
jgi:cyclase